MQITVNLLNNFEQHPDLARETLEAVAVAGYRSGKLTAFQARRILGFTSRFEFEAFLKDRGILDQAYSKDDLNEDLNDLRHIVDGHGNEDSHRE
jgi:predicted HTH domain antitoxin